MKTAGGQPDIRFPYPGLRPFNRHESPIFFGRGAEIDKMLTRLEEHRFLTVVGASGSGKSSLVRAGLLPALEEGYLLSAETNWHFVIMRPGKSAFTQLASAIHEVARGESDEEADPNVVAFTEATLRSGPDGLVTATREAGLDPDASLLVLVDQFEEIFRYRRSERWISEQNGNANGSAYEERNEAAAFVNLLLASRNAEAPIYVVLTMRSDFLGDCDAFHGLPQAIDDCQFLTPRMTRAQLQDAITEPLTLSYFGQNVDPTLVNQILNDVGTAPDQLPLMQHALMRTSEVATDGASTSDVTLQLPHYEATGKLAAALSNHADEVYEQLGDEGKKHVAELMFRCLCDRGAEARLTRRLATVSEVAAVAGTSTDVVIEVASEFLKPMRSFVTATPAGLLKPETTLDISHEALIRQWKRFRNWLTEESESATFYRRLSDTAGSWKKGEAGFWSELDLQMAQKWKERQQPNSAWAERYGGGFEEALQFLDASADAQKKERRKASLLKIMQGVIATALIVIGLLLWAFFWMSQQKNLVSEQKDLAEEAQEKAELAEKQNLRSAYNAQLARVQESWRDAPELAQTLLTDKRRCPPELNDFTWRLFHGLTLKDPPLLTEVGSPVYSVAVSPDGKFVASAGEDGVTVWNWPDRKETRVVSDTGAIYSVAFSPNGDTSAFAGRNGVIELWNLAELVSSEESARPILLKRHRGTVRSLAFSLDGRTLASGGDDTTIRLWDVESGQLRTELEGHSNWIYSLALSSDGKKLASASRDTKVKLWDVNAERELKTLRGHTGPVLSLAFSPDGTTLVSSGDDQTIRLWDVTKGLELRPPGPLTEHTQSIYSVAFSPDGQTLASADGERTIKLWDTQAWRERVTLQRHTGAVYALAFSADGEDLISASGDGTVKLWDAQVGVGMASDQFEGAFAVAFSPRSHVLATATAANSIRLKNTETGEELGELKGHTEKITSLAFGPDGLRLASASEDETVMLWDIESRDEPRTLAEHSDTVTCVAFDPAGEILASSSKDKTVKLWDVATDQLKRTLDKQGHTGGVTSVAFSADGLLASAGRDSTVRLWDAKSGQLKNFFNAHDDWVLCVRFSPDGKTLATTGTDNRVNDDKSERIIKLWNVDELMNSEKPEPRATLRGHTGEITCLAFLQEGQAAVQVSEDGDSASANHQYLQKLTLASGSMDNTIRLWDPVLGDVRGRLTGHSGGVRSLAFRRDGKVLASVGGDNTVKLWIADIEPLRW